MPNDNNSPFEIPFYTPLSPQSPSSSTVGSTRAKRSSTWRERYSPYAQAKKARHQMNMSYVDAAYLEPRVEIIQPEDPLEGLVALLRPPERRDGIPAFMRNIFFGAANTLFDVLAKYIDFLFRGLLDALA